MNSYDLYLSREEEKKRLNELGQIHLRLGGIDIGLIKYVPYYVIGGYGDYYLSKCWDGERKINKADSFIYRQLVGIDSKLGTSASEQLRQCLCWTGRWDLIKVELSI